jgi:hypothetical protein
VINDNDLELILLAGIPVEIEGVGEFRIPTIKEIIKFNESKYNEMLSILLINKNSFEIELSQDISDFDLLFVLSYNDENFKKKLLDCLEFFFNSRPKVIDNEEQFYFQFSNGNKLDKNSHEFLQRVIKKAHCINEGAKKEEFKPANSKAQELMDFITKSVKNKPKTKEQMNLHSIISGLSWKSNGINILNIFDLTIYQLYNGFFATENIDNYHHTLTGIYAGTIDGKKIKIPQIHWAKIIENK